MPLNMPTVSVIIPNFNHSKYLVERIESVLSQTYQDFEIILLDDCSTDDSKEIIKNYSEHPRVSNCIYNQQNSGSTFKQWKKGINLAKGKYIWFAESDDWCEPTLLETLVQGIEKDPSCVLSYCQSICVTDSYEIRFQSTHPKLSQIIDGHSFIQSYLSVPNAVFNASMALWRQDKFKFIPDDFTSFRFCGDWYFWIQLCRHGSVHISGKSLNYFRKHDNDVSSKAYKSGLNFIEELKIIDLIFCENLINKRKYLKAYRTKFIEYWLVKDQFDNANRLLIKKAFKNSEVTKISFIEIRLSALWKELKYKWKRLKKGI